MILDSLRTLYYSLILKDMPDTRLILHVKGTEAETTELSKDVVRTAVSQGQLTQSQLIWSPHHNAWKQVRELPELLPSQKLAPAPSRTAVVPVPRIVDAIIPESPSSPVARATVAGGTPQVRVAAAATPQVRVATKAAGKPTVRVVTPILVRTTGELVVKDEEEVSHPFKWICIGLGVLILLVLGGNYLLVDQPLVSNMSQTPYSNVTMYAHFGAFMQPNVMVIHIPASSAITPDNLTDFLVTLAHNTPQNPTGHDPFERVALTSGWMAQYSFSGYSWKELGDMQHESEARRKEFLMEQMGDAGGQPLMPESTLNEAMQKTMRDQVWETFAVHFATKP